MFSENHNNNNNNKEKKLIQQTPHFNFMTIHESIPSKYISPVLHYAIQVLKIRALKLGDGSLNTLYKLQKTCEECVICWYALNKSSQSPFKSYA